MSNVFRKAAERVENSPFIIPIFVVFVIMMIVGIGIFIEDYSTSFAGYTQLPTRKMNDWVIALVALLPQIGQIGFMYVFATDTDKRWAILIVFGLHFVDVATDVVYKADGLGLGSWVIAFVESEIVYTLGSEIMIVTSFGMLIRLFPAFIEQIGDVFRNVAERMQADDGARRPSQHPQSQFDRSSDKRNV